MSASVISSSTSAAPATASASAAAPTSGRNCSSNSISTIDNPHRICGLAAIDGAQPPNLFRCCGNSQIVSYGASCYFYCRTEESLQGLMTCVYGETGPNGTQIGDGSFKGWCQAPGKSAKPSSASTAKPTRGLMYFVSIFLILLSIMPSGVLGAGCKGWKYSQVSTQAGDLITDFDTTTECGKWLCTAKVNMTVQMPPRVRPYVKSFDVVNLAKSKSDISEGSLIFADEKINNIHEFASMKDKVQKLAFRPELKCVTGAVSDCHINTKSVKDGDWVEICFLQVAGRGVKGEYITLGDENGNNGE